MGVVNSLVLRYAVKGAKQARREDRKVAEQTQETAMEARRSTQDVNQWFQANKQALIGISAAFLSAGAAVASASPTIRSEFSQIRLGASLVAMEVGESLGPEIEGVGSLAVDAAEDFREWNDAMGGTPGKAIAVTLALVGLAGAGWAAVAALGAVGATVGGAAAIVAGVVGVFATIFAVLRAGGGTAQAVGLALLGLGAIAATVAGAPLAALAAGVLFVAGVLGILLGDTWEVASGVDQAWQWLTSRTSSAFSDLGGFAMGLAGDFATWIGGLPGRAKTWGSSFIGSLGSGIQTRWGTVKGRVSGIPGAIGDWFGGLASDAWTWGSDTVSDLASGAHAKWLGAKSKVAGVKDDVVGFFSGLPSRAWEWGKDLAENFADGLDSRKDAVSNAAQNAYNRARQWISHDIRDNDRRAQSWGRHMIEHFATGAEDRARRVQQALQDVLPSGGPAAQQLAQPVVADSGGAPVVVNVEPGAIVLQGSSTPRMMEDRLAEKLGEEVRDSFGGRTNR